MNLIIAIHRLCQKFGYDFRRYSSDNFPELKRKKIIDKQNINLVLDIGASEGFYGEELRKAGYKDRIMSFEPLRRSYVGLKKRSETDPLWESYNMALGDKEDEVEMSVSGHVTSSSLLQMTDAHLNAMQSSATVSKEKIKVLTLNSFIGENIKPSDRIYMKVDVQGFEMFVLAGADKVLDQVEAMEMELSLTPLYQGGPLFLDMMQHLQKLGFVLVSLSHVFTDPSTEQLLQVDGIFIKKYN